MMEIQKILKPTGKITIVSDYREREVIKYLRKLGATVNEVPLEVGDFICSDRGVIIERKSHSDFVSSIIDGRIFEQARSMKENFRKPIIIIEGTSDRRVTENALKGAIASLLIDFNVSLLTTKNQLDTAKTIYWIAKKEQKESKKEIGIKVGKKPKEIKKLQEFIVCSIPGVSTITAKRLLKHFGTVEKIFSASSEELQKVRGVGKKLAKRIRKVLSIEY